LVWACTDNGRKSDFQKNLETRRPRNRWQDEVREDGRIVGWRKVAGKSIRQEWKKVLRTARNCRILYMPME
jgi:hypothetical protein